MFPRIWLALAFLWTVWASYRTFRNLRVESGKIKKRAAQSTGTAEGEVPAATVCLASTPSVADIASAGAAEKSVQLSACLAEYNSLRTELLDTIKTRAQVMLYTVAAAGALAGSSFAIKNTDKAQVSVGLYAFVYSIAIPAVAVVGLVIWIGEAMRMKRGNDYLADELEPRINALVGFDAVGWEGALKYGRLPRDKFDGPSAMALLTFGLLMLASPFAWLTVSRLSGIPSNLDFWYGPLPWQVWVPESAMLFVGGWVGVKLYRIAGAPSDPASTDATPLTERPSHRLPSNGEPTSQKPTPG